MGNGADNNGGGVPSKFHVGYHTRYQGSIYLTEIIICGRYWRYPQTWHLPPPPHIIFSCNKSGFPAPGIRGGFVTTGYNYHYYTGPVSSYQSMLLLSPNTSAIAALDLIERMSTFPMFTAKVVMAKTTQGGQYYNFQYQYHFYSCAVYLQSVDNGRLFNTEM